jgi:hypothetical protein
MPRTLCIGLLFLSVGLSQIRAQFPFPAPPQGKQVGADTALNRAMENSSLVDKGRPFHAVLTVGVDGGPYSGRVEVWWAAPQTYKSVITSPSFSQTRIVNGDQVMESNTGDYYPRWLETFVDAILDPIPMIANFRGRRDAIMLGPNMSRSCLRRDDRTAGLTDWMTWGEICFSGDEPKLESVDTMSFNLEFSDWKPFGKKRIARTYSTDVLDYQQIVAHLSTLEDLTDPPADLFAITTPTPPEQQIKTAFVSTQKEESLLQNAPKIEWPTVHEGKTEGYMIVYARTDRNGQVRESAKHNSDNPGLESFGMEQAMRFKFNPLLVDGAPVQMEMPLVLHFTTKVADPLPFLTGEALLKQISGCDSKLVPNAPAGAKATPTSISVNEEGKLTGEGYGPQVDPGSPAVLVKVSRGLIFDCHFAPFLRDGVPWYYHGALLVTR